MTRKPRKPRKGANRDSGKAPGATWSQGEPMKPQGANAATEARKCKEPNGATESQGSLTYVYKAVQRLHNAFPYPILCINIYRAFEGLRRPARAARGP